MVEGGGGRVGRVVEGGGGRVGGVVEGGVVSVWGVMVGVLVVEREVGGVGDVVAGIERVVIQREGVVGVGTWGGVRGVMV